MIVTIITGILKNTEIQCAIMETTKLLLLQCQPLGLAKQIVISRNHTLCHISAFHPYAIYPPPKLPIVSEYECMPQVSLGALALLIKHILT